MRALKSILFAVVFVVFTYGAAYAQSDIMPEDEWISPADPSLLHGPIDFPDLPVRFKFEEKVMPRKPSARAVMVMPLSTFLKEDSEMVASPLISPRKPSARAVYEDFETIYAVVPFINKYPADAKVYLDEKGEPAVAEEKVGMRINLEKFEADIRRAFENYDASPITVEYELVPPRVKKDDLMSVLPKLNDIISQKITLTTMSGEGSAMAEKYTFDMKKNFEALDVKFTAYLDVNGRRIPVSMITEDSSAKTVLKKDWVLGLNAQKIDEYIKNTLTADLEVPAQDVTIIVEEPEVKENADWIYGAKITFEGAAQNGLIVERSMLINNMLLALNGENNVAEIPLKEVEAKVYAPEVLQDRGIKELFSVGYSNFGGSSWKRIKNIDTGVARFNGVIIPKDSVFSFNERLGRVDASTGYLEELVIKGDKTEPDFGGGLCQVSSTFFRAGLFGGLEIVERKAHSYAVSYYARPGGHGLDCTIYPGVTDCKIRNDTPGDLLIQAYTDGNDAYFKFYGTKDGRAVAMDGPYYSNQAGAPPDKTIYDPALPEGYTEEKEHPHNGFNAVWYRTLVNAAGEESTQTFVSKYQARPRVMLRGGNPPADKATAISSS